MPDTEKTPFNRGTGAQLSLICEFITKQTIPITLIGCELSRASNETTALPVPPQPTPPTRNAFTTVEEKANHRSGKLNTAAGPH
ncbi:hypothetical protein, partial [Collimonas fungivorans]|uniref:hypothetical protein n=1 Tax=Collimonas fungivorans TaxID=158899 RepID=UPI0026EC7813